MQGDVFVFCTDGIFEATSERRRGVRRDAAVRTSCTQNRRESAREIVDAIFDAVIAFRGGGPQDDDMTAVAVKITA